jgi:hypothetical protein
MKAADLITAQLHRSPHLMDTRQGDIRTRHESISARRRGLRFRRR